MVVGLQKVNAKYRIEPDRDAALEIAIDEAQAGDIVLLAGKGHETIRFCATARLSLTIAKRRGRFCGARDFRRSSCSGGL